MSYQEHHQPYRVNVCLGIQRQPPHHARGKIPHGIRHPGMGVFMHHQGNQKPRQAANNTHQRKIKHKILPTNVPPGLSSLQILQITQKQHCRNGLGIADFP